MRFGLRRPALGGKGQKQSFPAGGNSSGWWQRSVHRSALACYLQIALTVLINQTSWRRLAGFLEVRLHRGKARLGHHRKDHALVALEAGRRCDTRGRAGSPGKSHPMTIACSPASGSSS